MTQLSPRKIKCPSCKQETEFSQINPWRPFCSERCRLLDLGAWASEEFRVPSTESGSVQDFPTIDSDDDED